MRGKRKRKDAGVLSADEGFGPRGGGADGLSVDEAFGAAYAEETAAAGAAPAAREEQAPQGAYAGFGEKRTAVDTQKCPACGDNLQFDPATGKLKCPSCGTEQDIFAREGRELDIGNIDLVSDGWAREAHVYHCNNCNAEDVMDRREIAHVCPFCGSPNVVEKSEFSAMRPNALLPFAVERKRAAEQARQWAKKRLFAPNDFKKYFTADNMKGVYLPAFTFDTATYSVYDGKLGEHYYTTHTDSKGRTTTVQHTRYFHVSGGYDYFFDDIAVNAGDAVPQDIMRTLLAYDYANSVEYNEDFLYGFSALLYTRDGRTCWEDAKALARGMLRSQILGQYRYDVVSYLNVDTRFENVRYRYLLLPMYIGSYRHREKSYSFYVNGRNGRTKGKAPVSPFKAALAALIGAAVIAAIVALVYFFL